MSRPRTGATGRSDESLTTTRRSAVNSGLLLLAGPFLWLVGYMAFMPVLGAFYDPADAASKLSVISGNGVAWIVQSLILFSGTLTAAFGLGLIGTLLTGSRAASLVEIGHFGLAVVVGLYGAVLILRLFAASGTAPSSALATILLAAHFGWLAHVASLANLLTVGLYGFALWQSGVARTSGAGITLLALLVLLVDLVNGPLSPVFVYSIAALIGVRLLLRGPAQPVVVGA